MYEEADYASYFNARGDLAAHAVEPLLAEVCGGSRPFETWDGRMFATRPPTHEDRERARLAGLRAQAKARGWGLPERSTWLERCVDLGHLPPDLDAQREALETHAQRLDGSRAKSRDRQQKRRIDQDLAAARRSSLELDLQEAEVARFTADAYGAMTRIDLLACLCTLGGDLLDTPAWPNWHEYLRGTDHDLVARARASVIAILSGPPDDVLRALARHASWRERWKLARDNDDSPFPQAASEWNDTQRRLAYWTSLFDSILSHPDRPDAAVLRDESRLRDWLEDHATGSIGKSPPGGALPPRRSPHYRDGSGRAKPMTKVGEETREVNTPYRVRI